MLIRITKNQAENECVIVANPFRLEFQCNSFPVCYLKSHVCMYELRYGLTGIRNGNILNE